MPLFGRSQVSDDAAGGHRRARHLARRAGLFTVGALVLVLVSTAVNLTLDKVEKSRTASYGRRVPVAGGAMNAYRNGRPGKTIVLLGGLGTAAPGLDFAPLIRELDDYDVIVVEGFGYGYSDPTARPRTIENITGELHEVLSKLGVRRPYVLLGHSISGFYTLAYADRYPEELSAVIGIDPTVPSAKATTTSPVGGGINWPRALATSGVVRAVLAVAPDLAKPDGDAYTQDEIERMRLMTIWNFGNPAVFDETNRIADNAGRLRGVTYPDELPVLAFLSSETAKTNPRWVALHDEQLHDVRRHDIVVLDGGHYLHWTQSKAIAEKIRVFLADDPSSR